MDNFSKEKRSSIMAAVKSRGNKSTEIKLIAIFKQNGVVGWRRNYKLFGAPDFVFVRERVAVFVDGCFWHGHNCRNTKPKDNESYWMVKIGRNKARDKKVTEELLKKNWKVIRIWECELKSDKKINQLLLYLRRFRDK